MGSGPIQSVNVYADAPAQCEHSLRKQAHCGTSIVLVLRPTYCAFDNSSRSGGTPNTNAIFFVDLNFLIVCRFLDIFLLTKKAQRLAPPSQAKSRIYCTVPLSLFVDPGANPEKTLRIRGGAMQVYHHNQ